MKLYCAVVVYNCSIKESKTLERLLQSSLITQGVVDIYVVDNSTKDYGNFEVAKAMGLHYVSMNGNRGLSKAYNTIVSLLKGKEGYLVLFDDDTEIPLDYLNVITSAISSQQDVYLPLVEDQVGLLSPNYMNGKTHKRWPNESEIDPEHMSAINSGMVISLQVFEDFTYSEDQFLDFVDHYFMRYAKQKALRIELLNVKFFQNFSANDDNAKSSKIRFNILKKDLKAYYKEEQFGIVYYYFIMLRRGLRLCFRFHDFSYLMLWKKEI